MIKKMWNFFERIGQLRLEYHKRHGYKSWYWDMLKRLYKYFETIGEVRYAFHKHYGYRFVIR